MYGKFLFYSKQFLPDGTPYPEFVLSEDRVRQIMDTAGEREGYQLTVDLEAQTVTDGFGRRDTFEINAFKKRSLLNGLDPIGLTLQHEREITRFEATRPAWMPRVST